MEKDYTVSSSSYHSVTLTDTEQPCLMFAALNKFRKQQQFCDVEVRIGEAKFNCHQLILCASSPYLRKLVSIKPPTVSHITLSDTSLQEFAIEMLIDFIYTSVITINLRTVKPVCYAAKQLKLVRAEKACCKLILQSIKPDSCVNASIDHLVFALTNKYPSIRSKCVKHLTRNLNSLAKSTVFLSLTADKLYQVLNVFDPCSVAEMLTIWVEHDQASRQQYLQFLVKNLSHITIPSTDEHPSDVNRKPDNLRHSSKPITNTTSKVIYVVGGNTDESITAEVEMYSPHEGAWTVAPSLSNKKSHCALVSSGGQLYIIGGFDGSARTSLVEIYNPAFNTWIPGPSLRYARSGCGAAVFRGEIYVVGGYNGTKHMTSVELYNFKKKAWSSGPPLNRSRSYVQVAVANERLYAVGGADDNGRLSSVEILIEPYIHWIMGPSLTVPRSRPGIACIDNTTLYVCGGYDGQNHLSSIETLDHNGNKWTCITNMSVPRNSPGVCAIDKDLYVFGGYNGHQFLDSLQIYHSDTNTWSAGSPMTTPRCDFGCSTSSSPLLSITV